MAEPEKINPVLVDSKTAASMCGCGLTLWKELVTTGRTPEQIYLNSKVLFSTRQLELWALNGCPSRDSADWQRILKEERADIQKRRKKHNKRETVKSESTR